MSSELQEHKMSDILITRGWHKQEILQDGKKNAIYVLIDFYATHNRIIFFFQLFLFNTQH